MTPGLQFVEQDQSDERYPSFVGELERNTRTFQRLFAEAADRLMPAPDALANSKMDVFDILSEHVSAGVGGRGRGEGRA